MLFFGLIGLLLIVIISLIVTGCTSLKKVYITEVTDEIKKGKDVKNHVNEGRKIFKWGMDSR